MYSGAKEYTRVFNPIFPVPDTDIPTVLTAEDEDTDRDEYEFPDLKNGSVFASRYTIQHYIDSGTFGKVYQAMDNKTMRIVAIKLNAAASYKQEVAALTKLTLNDPKGKYHCIHLLDAFKYRDFTCLVTPLYSCSLVDLMEIDDHDNMPLPLSQVRAVAHQLFIGLAFIHDMGIIHLDIKPNNILVCDSQITRFPFWSNSPSPVTRASHAGERARRIWNQVNICIIDFGCSKPGRCEYVRGSGGALSYAAPEISLHARWWYPVDIWSVGCVILEMLTGDLVFGCRNAGEQLAKMEKVLGPLDLDESWCRRARGLSFFSEVGDALEEAELFRPDGTLNFPLASTPEDFLQELARTKPLDDIITSWCSEPPLPKYLQLLSDLLHQVLSYDPNKRITAGEASGHPWFSCMMPRDEGTVAATSGSDGSVVYSPWCEDMGW